MATVVYAATGKRKTAVARVRLMPGTGTITVNGKDVKEYFNRQTLTLMVRAPLVETGTEARYDVIAKIEGGGKSGQAGALKHGVARALVEERLAACVQILGPITSTYRWKGAIETSEEWQCWAKTRRDLYEKIEQAIRRLHSYEVPEIIAVPILAGSESYLKWLDEELETD
jgi:uncharacterized protein involved in tolerance to divalent cations